MLLLSLTAEVVIVVADDKCHVLLFFLMLLVHWQLQWSGIAQRIQRRFTVRPNVSVPIYEATSVPVFVPLCVLRGVYNNSLSLSRSSLRVSIFLLFSSRLSLSSRSLCLPLCLSLSLSIFLPHSTCLSLFSKHSLLLSFSATVLSSVYHPTSGWSFVTSQFI